jgi:pimeloyl-ACP methyl ester carboxylesterase
MTLPESLPLLLVPGTLCDARLWQAQIPALSCESSVQVIAWRDERDVGTLAARILAEAPARFALAGMSMGGSIALEVCAREPGRVAGLALLDAHPWADSPGRHAVRQSQLAFAQEHGLRALVRDRLWSSYVHPSRLDDAALLGLVQDMAEACGLAQFACQIDLLASRLQRLHVLAALRVPTLIAAGSDDVLCPRDWQQVMSTGLAQGVLAFIDGCGHFAVLESPQRAQVLLVDWLRTCRA